MIFRGRLGVDLGGPESSEVDEGGLGGPLGSGVGGGGLGGPWGSGGVRGFFFLISDYWWNSHATHHS